VPCALFVSSAEWNDCEVAILTCATNCLLILAKFCPVVTEVRGDRRWLWRTSSPGM
jgi:hypothetical protein